MILAVALGCLRRERDASVDPFYDRVDSIVRRAPDARQALTEAGLVCYYLDAPPEYSGEFGPSDNMRGAPIVAGARYLRCDDSLDGGLSGSVWIAKDGSLTVDVGIN